MTELDDMAAVYAEHDARLGFVALAGNTRDRVRTTPVKIVMNDGMATLHFQDYDGRESVLIMAESDFNRLLDEALE